MSLKIVGQEETEIEKLRSNLAQREFTYVVRQYDKRKIPFRTHLHVPETHPDTGAVFLEREDEGHVLKVTMKDNYTLSMDAYNIMYTK